MSNRILAIVVALTLLAGAMLLTVVAAGGTGLSYFLGWEGLQLGPILFYPGTVSTLLGLLCSFLSVALVLSAVAVYWFVRRSNSKE